MSTWIEEFLTNNEFFAYNLEYTKGRKLYAFLKDGSNYCIISHVQDKKKLEGYTCMGSTFLNPTGTNELLVTDETCTELYQLNPSNVFYDPVTKELVDVSGE